MSHFTQTAGRNTAGKSEIAALKKKKHFEFILKTFSYLNQTESISGFLRFQSFDSKCQILVIRERTSVDVFHFDPFTKGVYVTFNRTWIDKALASLDSVGIIDVDDLIDVVNLCATERKSECESEYLSLFLLFNDENSNAINPSGHSHDDALHMS